MIGNVLFCHLDLGGGREGLWQDSGWGRGDPVGGPVPYLCLSHVDASDMALLPHQLAQHVAVPATAAAQVQDPAGCQALRDDQATAIVPGGFGLSEGAVHGRWHGGEV